MPKEQQDKVVKFDFHGQPAEIKHGSVVIAAITSCTNTSNPSVMLGAALVAKKACELGLEVCSFIICSPMEGAHFSVLSVHVKCHFDSGETMGEDKPCPRIWSRHKILA